MKIYICHSSNFDYKKELYEPIRNSQLNRKYEIILPHEFSDESLDSRGELKKCKIVIAEVSYPSTGLGIELGWASLYGLTIVCIHKNGVKVSKSLNSVTNDFISYSNGKDLIEKLVEFIQNL